MSATPDPGSISWTDLTVADAEAVRDFYQAVVGWAPEAQPMGAYSDFVMNADGAPVAGICHARGANAAIPPVWLIYITVEDLEHSLDECQRFVEHHLKAEECYDLFACLRAGALEGKAKKKK